MYRDLFSWSDIKFPAIYEDYETFETLNSDVVLNIFYVPYEEENILPEYISKRNFDNVDQITLLKISDGKGKWHFLALPNELDNGIKRPYNSLCRLMRDVSSNTHDNYYCLGCFHSFKTKNSLEKHEELCKNNTFAKIELPDDDCNFKMYKPGAKSLKLDTVIYADFESMLVPYSTCDNRHETTKKINKQVPCSYSINIVSNHRKQQKQHCYCGEDAVSSFCDKIYDVAHNFINIKKIAKQNLIKSQYNTYETADYCHICKKVYVESKTNLSKVYDFHYYSGKYRGPAHSICSLMNSRQKDIPVFLHNGTNYEFNLIIRELAKKFRSDMQCIQLNRTCNVYH